MANQVMNIARGKIGYYADIQISTDTNGAFQVVVLEAAEADDTLNNYDTLDALLTAAGNTEATSINYTRKDHAAADVTWAQDDTNNDAIVTIDTDDTWTSVSQNASESWVKLLICYIPDSVTPTADTGVIPLSHHDFSVTPNGGDITANYDQVNGVWAST